MYKKWKENSVYSAQYEIARQEGDPLQPFKLSESTLDSLRRYTVELLCEKYFKDDRDGVLLKEYLAATTLDSFLTDYLKRHSTPPK